MPRSSEPEAASTRLVRGDPGEPHARFEHAVEIAVPRARLHAFLCALENLAPLHPLIESIRPAPPRAERPNARRYRVVDRIAFGPLRLRAAYSAELEPIAEDLVRGEAWQSPGIHLVTHYRLEALAPERTRLHETCVIRAPRGLRGFVARQASASHRATLAGMKRLIEAERAGP
ncbi:MAG: SRPBCC family protein [Myxococcota bacterium]